MVEYLNLLQLCVEITKIFIVSFIFSLVLREDEFLHQDFQTVHTLLSKDNLKTDSEEEVCNFYFYNLEC